MSFADKTAVVTGASSGIGRALAKALAARGARVGIVARRAEMLEDLAGEIRASGGVAEPAAADVADRESLHAAIHQLEARFGPTDLLVANAGVGLPSGADPLDVPNVELMMRVNFLGVVYAIDAVLPGMLARKTGHVVGISSLAAYKGLPGSAGYSASKAAVNNYLEAIRIELRPRGVAVTCVCPGFIDTPMTRVNTRPMPYLMTADEGARRILGALHRKPGVFDFPKPMRLLMQIAKWAPDGFVLRNVAGGKAKSMAADEHG